MTEFLLGRIGRGVGRPSDPLRFYQPTHPTGCTCALLTLLAVLFGGAACERGSPAPSQGPPQEREPPAAAAPPRIASLSPLATRFVRAIGAGDGLVAVASLEEALDRDPDWLLVPEVPPPGNPGVRALLERGGRVFEFAPHDLEDATALVRELGGELVGSARATRFEAAFSRPLARIGGASRGQPRPRVVAVVDLDPLTVAGGHSFETDLIEIAGGRSVTHPGEEQRLAIGADDWAQLAPELVLLIGGRPTSEREAMAVRNALPADAAVAWFDFDPAFWLDDDPAGPARRLRALIEPLASGDDGNEAR